MDHNLPGISAGARNPVFIMEWLNLHTSVLDSPEFIGSEPTVRATWLCLMRYCIGQENGGVIPGARSWGDRKWQQLVRITLAEAETESDLWKWVGDDLHVFRYPIDKQSEVQRLRSIGSKTSEAKRKAAQANGVKGGRPAQNPTDNPTENPTEKPKITHGKPIEGNGREGKSKGIGMEGEGGVGENPSNVTPFSLCSGSPDKPAPEPAPKKKAKATNVPDDQWLALIAKESAYLGLDVPHEFAKARVWADTHARPITRKFFINWLNRADRPMNGAAAHKPAPDYEKAHRYTV